MVRTLALFRFVSAVLSMADRKRGILAQGWLRARLSSVVPAPSRSAREPLAQLLAHVGVVEDSHETDALEAYQRKPSA